MMFKPLAIAVLVSLAPLTPATAVVAISQGPRDLPAKPPGALPGPIVNAGQMGMAFGEIIAALAGLAVIGLAMANGRQPHSVTA